MASKENNPDGIEGGFKKWIFPYVLPAAIVFAVLTVFGLSLEPLVLLLGSIIGLGVSIGWLIYVWFIAKEERTHEITDHRYKVHLANKCVRAFSIVWCVLFAIGLLLGIGRVFVFPPPPEIDAEIEDLVKQLLNLPVREPIPNPPQIISQSEKFKPNFRVDGVDRSRERGQLLQAIIECPASKESKREVIAKANFNFAWLPESTRLVSPRTPSQEVDLTDAKLRGAYMPGVVLSGAILEMAYFKEAVLINAHLDGADLRGADFTGARLNGADLRDAILAGEVPMGGAQFANLCGADLTGADLENALVRDDIWKKMMLSETPPIGVYGKWKLVPLNDTPGYSRLERDE